jgi:hypothetical protein
MRQILKELWHRCGGDLVRGEIVLAQGTLASACRISRRHCHRLLKRLKAWGLVDYYAPYCSGRMREQMRLRAGGMLKYDFIGLAKKAARSAKQTKSPTKSDVTPSSEISPLKRVKTLPNPASPELTERTRAFCHQIPLLKRWLERGKDPG